MSEIGENVNRKIRIIKRDSPRADVTPPAKKPVDTGRVDAEKFKRQDAKTVVMRWVGEMRERKDEETKAAFDSLFREAA